MGVLVPYVCSRRAEWTEHTRFYQWWCTPLATSRFFDRGGWWVGSTVLKVSFYTFWRTLTGRVQLGEWDRVCTRARVSCECIALHFEGDSQTVRRMREWLFGACESHP